MPDDLDNDPPTKSIPVVLVAFNRPEITSQCLDAIRTVKPETLFLICDGPRAERSGEAERCREVRSILDTVDWPCSVHRRYSDVNLGCTASIELGLDWVFQHVDAAMVLEDDCVPDPTFFEFAAELIDRYRDDPEVRYVGGSAIDTPGALFGGASYAFSSVAAAYGWASWADRWRSHRERYPRTAVPGVECAPVRTRRDEGADGCRSSVAVSGGYRWWLRRCSRTLASDPLPWDALWALSVACSDGTAITPSVNMVKNIGFGASATHTTDPWATPAADQMPFPLRHPSTKDVNRRVAVELEFDALWSPYWPLARRFRTTVGPGVVRTLVLGLLVSGPLTALRAGLLSMIRWVRSRGRPPTLRAQ